MAKHSTVLIVLLLLVLPSFLSGEDRLSVGTPVSITEPVTGNITVFWARADILAPVSGTVTVVGGPLRLGPEARVEGDVVTVFGIVADDPGSQVEGERISIGAAVFTGSERLTPGTLVFILLFWLALGLALLGLFPDHVVLGSQIALTYPGRVLFSGLLFLLAGSILLLLGFFLSGFVVGFPIIIVVVVALLAAKIYGLTLLLYALGQLVARQSHVLITFVTGVLIVFALRLIPYAGPLLWSLLTIPALGLSLLQFSRSRFQKRSLFEPPLLPQESDPA